MSRQTPMGWPGDEKRRADALYEFCKALDEDDALRQRCLDKTKPDAKDTFKKKGQYPNMPHGVEVRVFEIEDEARGDEMVVIRLPKKGDLPKRQQLQADQIWAAPTFRGILRSSSATLMLGEGCQ